MGAPDQEYAELLARIGLPLIPFGDMVRAMTTAATPPSEADLRQHIDAMVARSSTRSPSPPRDAMRW
jgi:vancomycin aglycone glucosyltransferase